MKTMIPAGLRKRRCFLASGAGSNSPLRLHLQTILNVILCIRTGRNCDSFYKLLRCMSCARDFSHPLALKQHYIVSTVHRHRCIPCLQDFASEEELRAHLEISHYDSSESNDSDEGSSSGDSWVTESSSDGEMYRQEDVMIFGCGQCGERFQSEGDLLDHYKSHRDVSGDVPSKGDTQKNSPAAYDYEKVSSFSMLSVCVICLHRVRSILLLPCRHIASCQKCYEKMSKECPICRSEVNSCEKVYLS